MFPATEPNLRRPGALITRVSELCGGGIAGPGVVLDLIVWGVAWADGGNSGLEELAAELGEHVGDGGVTPGGVPRAAEAGLAHGSGGADRHGVPAEQQGHRQGAAPKRGG